MFEPSDFKLSLEKELKLRVIESEVEHCTDIDALKEQLILCAKSLMTYQHMVGELVKREITRDLEMVAPEISKIVNEMIGKADGPSSSG
jgi:beta-lactamase regulating signal transducer with metallopeptidase domain